MLLTDVTWVRLTSDGPKTSSDMPMFNQALPNLPRLVYIQFTSARGLIVSDIAGRCVGTINMLTDPCLLEPGAGAYLLDVLQKLRAGLGNASLRRCLQWSSEELMEFHEVLFPLKVLQERFLRHTIAATYSQTIRFLKFKTGFYDVLHLDFSRGKTKCSRSCGLRHFCLSLTDNAWWTRWGEMKTPDPPVFSNPTKCSPNSDAGHAASNTNGTVETIYYLSTQCIIPSTINQWECF